MGFLLYWHIIETQVPGTPKNSSRQRKDFSRLSPLFDLPFEGLLVEMLFFLLLKKWDLAT